jgi:transcriptional regulator with XRE-family HTH domain
MLDKKLKIQKIRYEHGYTQKQLSELSGVPLRTIQNIELKQRANPLTLKPIAKVFECDVEALYEEESDDQIKKSFLEYESFLKEAEALSLGDSATAKASKELTVTLQNVITHIKFKSGNFENDCLAFLLSTPDELDELEEEIYEDFFSNCREKRSGLTVINRFVEIITSTTFKATKECLFTIGKKLEETGFDGQGALCITKVTEMFKANI